MTRKLTGKWGRFFSLIITLAVFGTTFCSAVQMVYAEEPPQTSYEQDDTPRFDHGDDENPDFNSDEENSDYENSDDENYDNENSDDENFDFDEENPGEENSEFDEENPDGENLDEENPDGENPEGDLLLEELLVDPIHEEMPYVSHVMLAMDEDSDTAKKIITDRGFQVCDFDLNGGTGGNFVYLGYKTTDIERLALTDIKVRRLHSEDMKKSDLLNYNYNGITYTTVVAAYGEKCSPIDSTFTGLMYKEMGTYEFGNTAWESLLESVLGSGAVTLDAFLSATFGGFSGMIDMFFTTEREERGSLVLYSTRDSKAGSPIVPDFVGSKSYECPRGYSPISYFATVDAADFNMLYVDNHLSDHYYDNEQNFLFFKHEQSPDYSEGEYLAEVILYSYIPPIIGQDSTKAEFMHDADIHGYTFYDYDIFPGIDGEAYIAYKTTDDPDKAITDIRLMGNVAGDKFGDSYTFKGGSTYTAVHTRRAKAPSISIAYTNERAFYGDYSMPKRALYVSTSPEAGEPVKAEFFAVSEYSQVDFSEWSPVISFVDNEVPDLTKGSGSSIDCYLFYKRPSDMEPPAQKKYYELLVPIFVESKDAAMAQALEKGCEGVIKVADSMGEWRITNWGGGEIDDYREVYLGYKKTDKRSAAITGIINYHNQPLENSYYKPSKSIKVDGINYQHAGILTPYVRIRHFSEWLDKIDTVVGYGEFSSMYTTTSSRAGDPITDIMISSLPMDEGFEDVVMAVYDTDFSTKKASNMTQGRDTTNMLFQEVSLPPAFLLYNRAQDEEKPYISEICVRAHEDTREGAVRQLADAGMKDFIDFDLNYQTGEDFVYLGFTRTADSGDAITGIITTHNIPHAESFVHEGIEYFSTGHVDTNTNVGGSNTIFVYYTKDPAAGEPITQLAADPYSSLQGFEVVRALNGMPSNLNQGASRKSVYLFVSRDNLSQSDYTASVVSENVSMVIIIGGTAIILIIILIAVVSKKVKAKK